MSPNKSQTLFSIPGPGRLLNILLSAKPYAAYTITDTANPGAPWLTYPYPTLGSGGNIIPGALQPALLVELFASTLPQTYGPGLGATTVINFNTTTWAGSFLTDSSGNVAFENFFLNPQGWPFQGYLVVSVTGIASVQTSVSASIMVEVM